MKKLISVLMILCLLLTSLPLAASLADVKDQTAVVTELANAMGISSKGGIKYSVTSSTDEDGEQLGGATTRHTASFDSTLKITFPLGYSVITKEVNKGGYYKKSTDSLIAVGVYDKVSMSGWKTVLTEKGYRDVGYKTIRGNKTVHGTSSDGLRVVIFNTKVSTIMVGGTYKTSAQKSDFNDLISSLIGMLKPKLTATAITKSKTSEKKSYSLKASTNSGATLKFSSSNSKLPVSSSGKVKVPAKYKGTATITITSPAYGFYAKRSIKVKVTIK